MTDIQLRAKEIYLDSATVDNDFKPLSAEKISKQLKAEGESTGSSTISRWKEKQHWEEELQKKIVAVGLDGETTDIVPGTALEASVKKTLVTVEKNQELISGSFQLLQKWIIKLQTQKTDVTDDQIKIVAKIYEMTSGREDKMLDRLANAGNDGGITPDEALAQLSDAIDSFEFEKDDFLDVEFANEET